MIRTYNFSHEECQENLLLGGYRRPGQGHASPGAKFDMRRGHYAHTEDSVVTGSPGGFPPPGEFHLETGSCWIDPYWC